MCACVDLSPTNMIELDAYGNNFDVIKINEVVTFFSAEDSMFFSALITASGDGRCPCNNVRIL